MIQNDTISRKAAIAALTGWDTDPTDEEIKYVLNKLATAEAEPVKHGRWIYDSLTIGEHTKPRCSVCNWGSFDAQWQDHKHYCSHCGAKMDLEG